MGYRGQFGKVAIDASGYFNQYKKFIGQTQTLVPLYGEAGDGGLSLLALQNGDFEVYQVYTNSQEDLTSYGGTLGIDSKIAGFDVGANYTYTKLEDAEKLRARGIRVNFNSPEHKVKLSLGKTDLFKNFGFAVNYRWSDDYFWEASFSDGEVPAYSVLDAQINYTAPKIKSVFKLGGSNLLADEYFQAIGSGLIGSIYYLSWTINP